MTAVGKKQQSVNSEKLLTICMPSYNRGSLIRSQVEFLCNFLSDNNLDNEIDVIVANNCSTDDTLNILSKLPYKNFRVHTHAKHYATAEENMFQSVELCKSEYVWFLGDDDPIQYNNLLYAIEQLRTRTLDCLVFNSSTMTAQGKLVLRQPIQMNAEYLDLTTRQLIETIGVLYTLAGISNIFMRTRLLSKEAGLKWLGIAPIYSHVAWFAEAIKTSGVRFFNTSIVTYRQNEYAGHWDRVATKLDVPSLSFWTTGLARLLHNLVKAGVLTHSNIANAYELAADGRRYRMIDDLLYTVFRQVKRYAQTLDRREKFSDSDLSFLFTFLTSCEPRFYDLVQVLSEGCQRLAAHRGKLDAQILMEEFDAKFHQAWGIWDSDGPYKSRYLGSSFGFDIYYTSIQYIGIRQTVENKNSLLAILDLPSDGATVVTGATRSAVIAAARASSVEFDMLDDLSLPVLQPVTQTEAAAPPPVDGQLRQQLDDANKRIELITTSTSWRLTAPVRAMTIFFRRMMR